MRQQKKITFGHFLIHLAAKIMFSSSIFGLIAIFIKPEERFMALSLGALLGFSAHIIHVYPH